MAGKEIRVAVNGCGVIAQRVADAVTRQPDMKFTGVASIVKTDAALGVGTAF